MCGHIDTDYGQFVHHPMDPRTPEPEGLTSEQPLGDSTAVVDYELGCFGTAHIIGALVGSVYVEADELAEHVLTRWRDAIGKELQAQREHDEATA